jgi:hypothetical protein
MEIESRVVCLIGTQGDLFISNAVFTMNPFLREIKGLDLEDGCNFTAEASRN